MISRNIRVAGRRTTVRLEPEMWDALSEICARRGCTIHAFCDIAEARRAHRSLTSALRIEILTYYRLAGTERGHNFAARTYPGQVGQTPLALVRDLQSAESDAA